MGGKSNKEVRCRSDSSEMQFVDSLPKWFSDEESLCQCRRHRRHGFDPWVRKTSWRKKGQVTPVFFFYSSILAWKIPGIEEPAFLATVQGVAKSRTLLSDWACTIWMQRGWQQKLARLRKLRRHGRVTNCPGLPKTKRLPSTEQALVLKAVIQDRPGRLAITPPWLALQLILTQILYPGHRYLALGHQMRDFKGAAKQKSPCRTIMPTAKAEESRARVSVIPGGGCHLMESEHVS